MDKFKDSIRALTKRTCGVSLEMVIGKLNPKIRSWFEYFKHAHKWTFGSLDGWIRRRLRAILRKHGTGAYVSPEVEPGNRRAVCGRTACTVRREGWDSIPTPIGVASSWLCF